MKKILGLDVGVSSVGIALVIEEDDIKRIEKLATRIVPEDPNFHGKFYSGNTASKNLERTTKRGIRRGYQRLKQRKIRLKKVLINNEMWPSKELIDSDARTIYGLRAKAVTKELSLKELGRVFIHLNQRRGFLSNRKSNSDEESSEYKNRIKQLETELDGKTIGQHLNSLLESYQYPHQVLLRERTYLRYSYLSEFDRIWDFQKQYFPNILTGGPQEDQNSKSLYNEIRNKIIYYQRPLKSQKGLVSKCPFEKHHKAVTKSSPYFELFRIWQSINNLSWKDQEGNYHTPTLEQKKILSDELFYGYQLNSKYKLTISKIKYILGYKRNDRVYFNYTELDGSKTYSSILNALKKADISDPTSFLFFNLDVNDEKGGLLDLWHITYSLDKEIDVINTLEKRFGWTEEQSKIIAKSVYYGSDYGNLSTRAIRKLLPYMMEGKGYSEACDQVGYDHSGYKTEIQLEEKLKQLRPNQLRNPVVEQILNQVVNIVNTIISQYGKIDEIRVELARELRNSAKTRNRLSRLNSDNRKLNDKLRKRLMDEYGYKIVNGRDVKRYRLWEETDRLCLYCNNHITIDQIKNGGADLEHVLPKSRSFNNSMNNLILAHRECNAGRTGKNQMTAYDYMQNKGEEKFYQYISHVNDLYDDGKGNISRSKFENLMCKGEDIPSDFVDRMKKDTQYIAKESVKLLSIICPKVLTTTGQVTDLLRSEWGLKNVLQEITMDKYRLIGETITKEYKDSKKEIKTYEAINNWSKRADHRHHAVDALICALTDQKIIFKLNNLNKIYQAERHVLGKQEILNIEEALEGKFSLSEFFDQKAYESLCPIKNIREEAKRHLEELLVSFKKPDSKVLTPSINKATDKKTWTPRGRLHEETVMSRILKRNSEPVRLNKKFNAVELIVNSDLKKLVIQHLGKYEDNPIVAFDSKVLKKDPIIYKNETVAEVMVFEKLCSKRVNLDAQFSKAQLKNVLDGKVKEILTNRIEKYGNMKDAFKNITDNPIWLNKEKGIQMRRVSVADRSKVEKVNKGYAILGNNHHAIVYRDEIGNYNDRIVSFWDAVNVCLANIEQTGKPYPIIDRNDDLELGLFQFSIQKNDLFVIDLLHSSHPAEDNEIDFANPNNRALISKHLFRVQKISKSSQGTFQVDFRHHLESTTERTEKILRGITWERFQSNKNFVRVTKIRVNHLGDIIRIGE